MIANAVEVKLGTVYHFPSAKRKNIIRSSGSITVNWVFVILAVFIAAGIWQSVQIDRLLKNAEEISYEMRELYVQQERIATEINNSRSDT